MADFFSAYNLMLQREENARLAALSLDGPNTPSVGHAAVDLSKCRDGLLESEACAEALGRMRQGQ